MPIHVVFNACAKTVSIGNITYTEMELRQKQDRTKIETLILKTLEKLEPGDEDTDEGDEIYRLALSDAFKGDYHSLKTVVYKFWE